MKRILIISAVVLAAIAGILILKYAPSTTELVWGISNGGAWLLPLVIVAAVLDSVHPCSFSILLITIAFLFGMQMSRKNILKVGGAYIAGIFASYLLIGLGALQVLHLFNTPHFMGKLGAALLMVFGIINLINALFPSFPIKLKIPTVSRAAMGSLMEKASVPAAFLLGGLVGICQFPCMGGPYLMVIGLLHDKVTYAAGLSYLTLYNLILILPLVAVLWFAADKAVVDKLSDWKRTNLRQVRLWAGVAMLVLGFIIAFLL